MAAEVSPSSSASPPQAPWLSNVTFHGLLASLTPLIPLPLLDDWAAQWVEKRLVRETLRLRGFSAETWHVEVLIWDGEEGERRGCLFPVVVVLKVTLYVLKKIFRKLLVFLLVKDCVDRFSAAFHHGYLLHVAFERGAVDAQVMAGGERLIEVRQAILATCEAVDPRLLNQLVRRILTQSRRALLGASRLFGKLLRTERKKPQPNDETATRPAMADQEEALKGLVEQMSGALWSNAAYRAELERVFAVALATRVKRPG